jgi:hypothetical protein
MAPLDREVLDVGTTGLGDSEPVEEQEADEGVLDLVALGGG